MNITINLLSLYYSAWKEGKTAHQIQKVLCISRRNYAKHEPEFLAHCRLQAKHEESIRLQGENKDPPNIIPLTRARHREFLAYCEGGLPYDKAARIMNVPLTTVMEYWFKDLTFKAAVQHAVEIANMEVISALKQRAVGYTYTEEHFEERIEPRYDLKGRPLKDEEGKPVLELAYTSLKKLKKSKAPDVKAQEFWLINRDSEHWSKDGSTGNKKNQGRIIEYLDKQERDQPEFVDFDKEQEKHDDKEQEKHDDKEQEKHDDKA